MQGLGQYCISRTMAAEVQPLNKRLMQVLAMSSCPQLCVPTFYLRGTEMQGHANCATVTEPSSREQNSGPSH